MCRMSQRPPADATFPDLLGWVMTTRRWDQADLAHALNVDQTTVSRWLMRTRTPRRDMWAKVASVAAVPIETVAQCIARTEPYKRKSYKTIEAENRQLRARLARYESVLEDGDDHT